MASASFSSDVLQTQENVPGFYDEFRQTQDDFQIHIKVWDEVQGEMETFDLFEAIQILSLDSCEERINEKKEMGWDVVHEEIENLPYCEIQGQITKAFLCLKCSNCSITGQCVACHEKEKKIHTLVDPEKVWELEEKGFARIWQ